MVCVVSMAIVAFVVLSIHWLADWCMHLTQSFDEEIPYGFAGYMRFKKEFDQVDNWRNVSVDKYSVRSEGNYFDLLETRQDEFFAGRIIFNYRAMIMYDPISYQLAKRYVKKYMEKNNMVKTRKVERIKEWR